MQHIVVEVVGKKKTVTVEQLRDLFRRNYVSTNAELSIDGVVCRIDDVRDQLLSGASKLTPTNSVSKSPKIFPPIKLDQTTSPDGAESPLFDHNPNDDEDKLSPPETTLINVDRSPQIATRKIRYGVAIASVAILVLIVGIVALLLKNSSQNHTSESQQARAAFEERKDQDGRQSGPIEQKEQDDNSDERLFDLDELVDEETADMLDKVTSGITTTAPAVQNTDDNNFSAFNDKSSETADIFDFEQASESSNYKSYEREDEEYGKENNLNNPLEKSKTSNEHDVEWDASNPNREKSNRNIPNLTIEPIPNVDFQVQPPSQTTKDSENVTPLLIVDHDKIFADFFSNNTKKDKIPPTILISSPKQLEQTLAKLDDRPHTIVLKPNSSPYELRSSTTFINSVTIKGESGKPADATILVVPESTSRLGALEVSGGELTLDSVTIKRNASCSEEYAIVAVDSKGKVNVSNCVFDASTGWGGRGISVVGIGSSANLEGVAFKGFADGVYAFSSSRTRVTSNCVFEENERGATVADGAELVVSDSLFTRNKVGVQVKTDGTGSLTESAFENNDSPCVVDSYSERKFKRSNNQGLD